MPEPFTVPHATLLKINDVAEMLSVCDEQVKALIARGELKAVRLGPATRRVTRASVEDYVARLIAEATDGGE
jgi:excisionase family DNA binding protein